MRKRLSQADTVAQLDTIQRLAEARAAQSKFAAAREANDEAFRLAPRLFPEGDHRTAKNLNLAGFIERSLGNLERAEALYSQALEMHRQPAPGDHPDVATVMLNLGGARRRLGRFQEAEPVLREALAMNRRLFRGDHSVTAGALQMLGQNLQALGRLHEAQVLLTESIAISERLYATGHPQRAAALSALAGIYLDQGRAVDAERSASASVSMNRRLFGSDHAEIVVGLQRLARSNAALSRWSLALENAREANAMAERLYPAGSPARKSANDFLASLAAQASTARAK